MLNYNIRYTLHVTHMHCLTIMNNCWTTALTLDTKSLLTLKWNIQLGRQTISILWTSTVYAGKPYTNASTILFASSNVVGNLTTSFQCQLSYTKNKMVSVHQISNERLLKNKKCKLLTFLTTNRSFLYKNLQPLCFYIFISKIAPNNKILFETQKLTFLFLKQFKTVDAKTQICS